ncbi:MAG TPA: peptidase M50 [Mycobacterium sp.]|nr:peptidase M50 [Mycobacterium sp.]
MSRPLNGLPVLSVGDRVDVDAAIGQFARLVVVGGDADLAAVLTRLLRADRLDVEVGYAPNRWAARRARNGIPTRVPLIRDETGQVIVGAGQWVPTDKGVLVHGEAVVDDTALFDGDVAAVRIEPTVAAPGLRAGVVSARGRVHRWVIGRAAQLGTTGAVVIRDGVAAPRPVKRSTFYRHTQGWLLVR